MTKKLNHIRNIRDSYWVTHFFFFLIIAALIMLEKGNSSPYFNTYFYYLLLVIYFFFFVINLLYYKAIQEKLRDKNHLKYQFLYSVFIIMCSLLLSISFDFQYSIKQFISLLFIILISLTCGVKLSIVSASIVGAVNFLLYENSIDILFFNVFFVLTAWVVGRVSEINFQYAFDITREQQFLFDIINSSTEGFIISNSEGRIINCNQRAEQIFGIGRDKIIGELEAKLWSGCNVLHSEQEEFINKGVKVKDSMFLVSRFNIGTEKYGDNYTVTVINDVTKIERQQRQIANLRMLSAIGELAAGVAHEIKNPLTTIKGFLQLTQGDLRNSKFHSMSEMAVEELERINRIINSLLQMSKEDIDEERFESVNLNEIIEKTWDLYTYTGSAKGIVYKKELLGMLPAIRGNPKQIQQVILNLMQNAERACSKGDTITVKTYTEEEWVCLDVSDTGTGVPQEKLDKIMLPFYSEGFSGTGLGLAICNKIVSEHDGFLQVKSKPGEGTTISIKIKQEEVNQQERVNYNRAG